jgi:hypothetical protein
MPTPQQGARMVSSDAIPPEPNVASIAERSLARLIRLQNADGSFLYSYDAELGLATSEKYNVVRHAGCAYALSWALSLDEIEAEGLADATKLAIDYLIRSLREYRTGLYVTDRGGITGNLGATALLSCTLSFNPIRREYRDLYLALRSSLTNAQQRDGSFRCRFDAPADGGRAQAYYPGEALLAIGRYLELGMDSPIFPDLISLAFEYYRNLFEVAPHSGMVLWHADAWTRMYRASRTAAWLGSVAALDYLNFAIQIVDWILPYQISPTLTAEERLAGGFNLGKRPGITTALYVEALIRVAQALSIAGHCDVSAYNSHIEAGTQFVARLHYSAEVDRSGASHWTSGGTPTSLKRKRFRMDNDQHVITMCLAAMEAGYYRMGLGVLDRSAPVSVDLRGKPKSVV